jgi:hypothetical protein
LAADTFDRCPAHGNGAVGHVALVKETPGTMTREEALAALKAEQLNDDPETAHVKADAILCRLLGALGYGDVVAAWDEVEKWYH